MIISQKALGWLLIVLGVAIGGFCAYGVLSGLSAETRDTAINLIWGGLGMIVLGGVCLFLDKRKK